ncbi:MAG: hypothetical protein U0T81_03790 [Saprospiraceae bacterium]
MINSVGSLLSNHKDGVYGVQFTGEIHLNDYLTNLAVTLKISISSTISFPNLKDGSLS